jgi:hypothetical protein
MMMFVALPGCLVLCRGRRSTSTATCGVDVVVPLSSNVCVLVLVGTLADAIGGRFEALN